MAIVNSHAFLKFLNKAMSAGVSYHRVRKALAEELSELLSSDVGNDPYVISQSNLTAILSVLGVRNEELDANARLSWITTILDLRRNVVAECASLADRRSSKNVPRSESSTSVDVHLPLSIGTSSSSVFSEKKKEPK